MKNQNILTGLLSRSTVEMMTINDGAYGWGGAFGSLYWIDPGEALIAQLVIQKLNDYAEIRGRFISLVYQAIID